MSGTHAGLSAILFVLFVINLLLRLSFAAGAFYRLRLTSAGLLVGGSYVLLAGLSIVLQVVVRLSAAADSADGGPGMVAVVSSLAHLVLFIGVGIGILLIPASLVRLERERA